MITSHRDLDWSFIFVIKPQMDGYYTSAIDPGISNWDMQAPSNTINGALPMRTITTKFGK